MDANSAKGPDEVAGAGSDDHSMPTWVKAFAIGSVLLAAVFLVLAALDIGDHGPGRHAPPTETPATDVLVDHAPPAGQDDG